MPRSTLVIKSNPITDDYDISDNELGVGMSGKVGSKAKLCWFTFCT